MQWINTVALNAQKNSKPIPWLLIAASFLIWNPGQKVAWRIAASVFPALQALSHEQDTVFRVGWLAVHVLVPLIFTVTFVRRYPRFLFGGICARDVPRIVFTGLIFALPLTCWYAINIVRIVIALREYPLAADMLHEGFWGNQGWGLDAVGVVSASISIMLIGPIFEEMIMTGSVLTRSLSLVRTRYAVLASAVIFAFLHLHRTGFTDDLLKIFLLGLTVAAARVFSGSWISAVIAHMVANALVIAPGWLAALIVLQP